jgi:hypothetical protein
MKPYRWLKISSLALLGFGIIATFGGYQSYSHARALLRRAVPARGVVVGYRESESNASKDLPYAAENSGTTYYPRIRFQTSSGQQAEFEAGGSNRRKHPVNTAVEVIYDPHNPSDAMLRSEGQVDSSSLAVSLIPGGVSLFLGTLALVILVVLNNRLAWLHQNGRRISADFIRVVSERDDDSKSYYVVCQWVNPETNRTHYFKSYPLSSNPESLLVSRKVDVLIDPGKPNRYWIDLDSLTSGATR